MRTLEFILILVLIAAAGLMARDDLSIRRQLGAAEASAGNLQEGREADVRTADARQAVCTQMAADAVRQGIAVARASAVRPRTDPKVQPLVTSAQIEAMLQ